MWVCVGAECVCWPAENVTSCPRCESLENASERHEVTSPPPTTRRGEEGGKETERGVRGRGAEKERKSETERERVSEGMRENKSRK